METQLPPKGRRPPPIFGPCLLWPNSWMDQDCGQTAVWIKMPLGTEVGFGPGHIVLDGDPAPPKGAQQPPHLLARTYCGQTAGWIRIPLGMEVGLGPGDTVRWDQVPLGKGHSSSPTFRPTLLWHGRPSQLLLSTCTHKLPLCFKFCFAGLDLQSYTRLGQSLKSDCFKSPPSNATE